MSDTIQETETGNAEMQTPETVEVSETENTEAVETENTETVEIVEKTPAEKAQEAINALDESNPLRMMVGAMRTALSGKVEAINKLVAIVREGSEGIEAQIDQAIEDSEDVEVIEANKRIEKMRNALDEQIANLRSKIAEENDLKPMTETERAAKEKEIADERQKYNAAKSSSEKALKNMLDDEKMASVFFGDLNAPDTVSGKASGKGGGERKPRLASVTVEFKGESVPVTATGQDGRPTFSDVAKVLSEKSGQNEAGNRIRPSDVSNAAISAGLDTEGQVTFEYEVNEANRFKIHAVSYKP
jgi:hypothetical protein